MLQFDLFPALITGLTIAIFHAALPTHWLPFVLASRTQKWGYRKTLSILLIAGSGHVLTTILLGAAVVWFGLAVNKFFEEYMIYIAIISVASFGLYNIIQHFNGHKHSHCDHTHPHHHDFNKESKDGWAILSLLALLTFSPCESFLPIYVSAWPLGWTGFFALSVVLAMGTVIAMTVFMSIFYYSAKKVKMNFFEDNEKLIIGVILILLAVVIYLTEVQFPHQH